VELAFPVAQNGIERAIQTQSVIAHNLANLTTIGFKARRAESGTFRVPGTQIVDTLPNPSQGPLKETGYELDMAVAGEGFFIVRAVDRQAFTRAGNFRVDEEGTLVTAAGYPLETEITVPEEAKSIAVSRTGFVFADLGAGEVQEIGQIELARFRNPAGLLPIGDNSFVEGPNSGDALIVEPGEEGAGEIHQGFREHSNVDEATEITNQIINQRHFQVNLRAFQVMNDLVGRTIDLAS
jgi:flagellar basal-body rod protein FlgG